MNGSPIFCRLLLAARRVSKFLALMEFQSMPFFFGVFPDFAEVVGPVGVLSLSFPFVDAFGEAPANDGQFPPGTVKDECPKSLCPIWLCHVWWRMNPGASNRVLSDGDAHCICISG